MGRKPKYSTKSDQRTEIRLTPMQNEILSETQMICKANNLPHSKHDVMIAGLNMYYDYLLKSINRKKNEAYTDNTIQSNIHSIGLFDRFSN